MAFDRLEHHRSSYPRLTDFARYKFFARLLGGFSQLKTVRIFNGGVGFQFIKEIHLFDSIKFTSRVVGHDRYTRAAAFSATRRAVHGVQG